VGVQDATRRRLVYVYTAHARTQSVMKHANATSMFSDPFQRPRQSSGPFLDKRLGALAELDAGAKAFPRLHFGLEVHSSDLVGYSDRHGEGHEASISL
jgi:hypothetical protein